MSNIISFNDFQKAAQNNNIKSIQNKNFVSSPILAQALAKTSTEVQDKVEIANTAVNAANTDIAVFEKQIQEAKNQNGLIEKAADKIKGALNFGMSSKKLEKMLDEVKQGKLDEKTFKDNLDKYRASQENTLQTAGDLVSILAASAVFFGILNKAIMGKGIINLNTTEAFNMIEKFIKNNFNTDKLPANVADKLKPEEIKGWIDKLSDKKTGRVLFAVLAGIVGKFAKKTTLKINRIGTKQYKPEIDNENMTKKEIKQAKKDAKKAKRNANFRNGASGFINGLTLPIVGSLGVAGVPIYLGLNMLNRYFIGTREDRKQKSIGSFVENVKASPVTYAAGAALAAVPLVKKGQYSAALQKNVDKTVDKLLKAHLEEGKTATTVYQELEDVILGNPKISSIINDETLSNTEKIRLLSDENIFALKFKQIKVSGDPLTAALKEECPTTWTLEEAQKEVDRIFGAGKYAVSKTVGTGTVAQTFEATADDGATVCIKMIHQGITPEKITKDKEAFIALINASDKSEKEKKFLIENLENLAEGILAEADLSNEMKAAKQLESVTKKAHVVKPITVKDNVYVMEKAKGVSLATLTKYQSLKQSIGDKTREEVVEEIQRYQRWVDEGDDWAVKYLEQYKDALKDYDKYLELKTMGLDALTDEESVRMLAKYQDILIEQFNEVSAKGKTIHGDIHPGNIFIDIDALKQGKQDFFTLIDTGNTIEQTSSQALRFMNLTNYVNNADWENITSFVLEGATLPEGMSEKQAYEIISNGLKTMFFDDKTAIGLLNNDSILKITDTLMKQNNIIPASTQGNLLKAKQSADNSFMELMKTYFVKKADKLDGADSMEEGIAAIREMASEQGSLMMQNKAKIKAQEKLNLKQMPLSERLKIKRGKNAPKKNSEDYVTFKLKQFNLVDMFDKLKAKVEKLDDI